MMSSFRVGPHRISLSGTYGGDGLPCDVTREVYDKAMEIPKELEEKFWKGGGHNSSGAEAEDFWKWGRDQLLKV